MKYFAAIFLCALLRACIRADDLLFDDQIDGDDPDRHAVVQCTIDLYDCMRLDKEGNLECLKKYKTCMAQLIPTMPPDLKKCINDLADCIKGNNSKVECFKKYRTCVVPLLPTLPPLPTFPPFIAACKVELKKCNSEATGFRDKLKCALAFGKCLINKGPAEVAQDAIEDAGQAEDVSGLKQCSSDLVSCLKTETDKKECFKDYRACIYALIPPYVKECRAKAKECIASNKGLGRLKCYSEYLTCLKNGASTQPPPEPSVAF